MMLVSLIYTSAIVVADPDEKKYQTLITYTGDNQYITQLKNATTHSDDVSQQSQPSDDEKIHKKKINNITQSRFQSFDQLLFFFLSYYTLTFLRTK